MNIGGVTDISIYLAQQASNMKSEKISQAIGAAVLKQTLDLEMNMGIAIVRMIQNTLAPEIPDVWWISVPEFYRRTNSAGGWQSSRQHYLFPSSRYQRVILR